MRTALALVATAALLGACATPVTPTPDGPPMARDGDDCAIIAAVAKEHYRFNTTNNLPPPLWLDGEGSGWAPRCDWAKYGLSFPATYDPDRPHRPGERIQWVSFKQPHYEGSQGALIESGILHGTLAGMGVECRVLSGFVSWTVVECRNTWIS